jgi:putative sporulation protein YyaC
MPHSFSIDINSTSAVNLFANSFAEFLETYYTSPYQDLVIICIGTDRSTGDSLGPLTGYKLVKLLRRHQGVYIEGTLENPVHAKNLQGTIDMIYQTRTKPFIVAIDACLGKIDRVGNVTIGHGPLRPGAGVKKELPSVGDIHVTGIVNLGGFMEYIILQNTRLGLVMKMADTIALGIQYGLWKYYKVVYPWETSKERFFESN